MKRKFFAGICLAGLFAGCLLFFTSCETLDNIGDKISGIFASDKDEEENSVSGKASPVKIQPRQAYYATPESYEKAYSYRTDLPDKTIQAYIKNKNVDSLRQTNPNEYIKSIAGKINESADNDFERVKLVHDVICLLISYDAKNFWANTVPSQDWQSVLKTKTAVCEGYANLFQQFMTSLKISSQKVSGYARGVGTDILTENPKASNHAWNIVKIEDCWYLVDCTWDAGYMKGKSAVQAYSTDWLFLKPEHFVYTHFPSDSKNQLIQPALSAEDFSALPDFRPKLFEIAGDSFSKINKNNSSDSSYLIEAKIKEGWKLTYTLSAVAGPEVKNGIWTEKEGGTTATTFQFPKAGVYNVFVYYGKESALGGQSCGQFIVNAREASSIKYPTVYPVKSKSAKIVSPRTIPLTGGENIGFEVFCDDRAFVAVIIGRNFIQLDNDGNGNFTGQVSIPKGSKQISIGLSATGRGSYETLAVFEVK